MTPLQASSTRVWCKLTLMAAGKPDMDSTRFTVTLAFLRSMGQACRISGVCRNSAF